MPPLDAPVVNQSRSLEPVSRITPPVAEMIRFRPWIDQPWPRAPEGLSVGLTTVAVSVNVL